MNQRISRIKKDERKPAISYFSPFEASSLDKLENALLNIRKEIANRADIPQKAKDEVISWINAWLYGSVAPFSSTPWDIIQREYPWGEQKAKEVYIEMPYGNLVGSIFQKHLSGIEGVSVQAMAPKTFGPLQYKICFNLQPQKSPVYFATNPFNTSMLESLDNAFASNNAQNQQPQPNLYSAGNYAAPADKTYVDVNVTPQKIPQEKKKKSRVQMQQELEESPTLNALKEKSAEERKKEQEREEKGQKLAQKQKENRAFVPDKTGIEEPYITSALSLAEPGKPQIIEARYDSKNNKYVAIYLDKDGILQQGEVPAELVELIQAQTSGSGFGSITFDSIVNFLGRMLLPIDSIENIAEKYEKGETPTANDWIWLALDVGLTAIEIKAAMKVFSAARNARFLRKDVIKQINAGLEEKFAGDPAKIKAAKRAVLRKFITKPPKAKTERKFIGDMIKIGEDAGKRYSTKQIREGVTRATIGQRLKRAGYLAINGLIMYDTIDKIGNYIEIEFSKDMPEWAYEEHPEWKGLPKEEVRKLAQIELRLHMAEFWCIFEAFGIGLKMMNKALPYINKMNEAVFQALKNKANTQEVIEKYVSEMEKALELTPAPENIRRQAVINLNNYFSKLYSSLIKTMPEIQAVNAAMNLIGNGYIGYKIYKAGKSLDDSVKEIVIDETNEIIGKDNRESIYQSLGSKTEKMEFHMSDGRKITGEEAEKNVKRSLEINYAHFVSIKKNKNEEIEEMAFGAVDNILLIDPRDPDHLKKMMNNGLAQHNGDVIEGTKRYSRMVRAIRELAPELGKENGGSEHQSIRKLLVTGEYDKKKIEELINAYYNDPVGFWLDVERLATRWKDEGLMKMDIAGLPAEKAMLDEWKSVRSILEQQKSMTGDLEENTEDKYYIEAMKKIICYALWCYIGPDILKTEKTQTRNFN